MGYLRTTLLLAGITALFLGVGFLIGGAMGAVIALAIACAMNLFAWWNSDKMVLRMYGAREVDKRSAPGFYGIVEQLALNADLPMPRVYIIDEDQPNAFATGRNPDNAAVAATRGLIERLSHEETAAVMAHELAHVRNRDTLIQTLTATLAGAIGMLANFAFFFGGHDYSASAGFPGTATEPQIVEKLDAIQKKVRARGVPTGVVTFDTKDVPRRVAQGVVVPSRSPVWPVRFMARDVGGW